MFDSCVVFEVVTDNMYAACKRISPSEILSDVNKPKVCVHVHVRM